MLTIVIFIGTIMLAFINTANTLAKKYEPQLLKKLNIPQSFIDISTKIRDIAFRIAKSGCYLIILVSMLYKLVPNFDKSFAASIWGPICYFIYILIIMFFGYLDITGRYYGDFCEKWSDTIELVINRVAAYSVMIFLSFLLESILKF